VGLDQHVQKYFKSPPKSPEHSLHRRQGSGKVNRPVQQLASSYLAAANPNLCKRRDKVCLSCIWSKNSSNVPIPLHIVIRIIEHLVMIVAITQTSQQIVLNLADMCLKVGQYQTIKMLFQTQNFECQVWTNHNLIN
jgi:hypothetical protein